MDHIERGGVSIAWDEERRLLHVVHPRGAPVNAEAATYLCDVIEAWVADEPFLWLFDASGGENADPGWRNVWTRRMQKHVGRTRIAVYNAEDLDGMTVAIASDLSGVEIRRFRSEAEAREWLGVP